MTLTKDQVLDRIRDIQHMNTRDVEALAYKISLADIDYKARSILNEAIDIRLYQLAESSKSALCEISELRQGDSNGD